MSVARHTAYNLAGSLIPVALALVTVPLYLRLIGIERYGLLSIAWLFLGYFGLFDLGLGRAAAQGIAALRDAPAATRAATLWTALAVNAGMGAVGAAILWAVAGWYFAGPLEVDDALRAEAIASLPWLALSVPIATTTGVLLGALQGRERFAETNAISVASTALFQLVPLAVAVVHGPDLFWLLAAGIAVRVATLVPIWRSCRAHIIGAHPFRFDRARFGDLLSYGGWITVSSLVGPLMVTADRFAIGAVLGAAAVSLYTVPFQLAQRLGILPGAIANALFPRLAGEGEAHVARALSQDAMRTAAAIMTPPVAIGILAMGPFLTAWVGAEFAAQATPIGRIALLGFWLNGVAQMPFALIQARADCRRSGPRITAFLHLGELLPYFAAVYLLAGSFGLPGVAAAFGLRCGADFLILGWLAYRRSFRLGTVALLFAPLLALVAAPALFANAPAPPTPATIAGALALVAALTLLCWFCLPPSIREKMRIPLSQLPGRVGRHTTRSSEGRDS